MSRAVAIAVALTLAGGLVGVSQGTASASTCVSWTGSQPANPSSSGDVLTGVSVRRPCDVWTVGFKQVGVVTETLTEHWNGLAWTPMPSSNPGGSANDNNFAAVAVKSSTDGWAVGHYSNGTANQTLIELLSAGTWEQVSSPDPAGSAHDNFLSGVAITSAKNAWAVGTFIDSGGVPQTLIVHWNGSSWKRESSPDPGGSAGTASLDAVAASSASNAWAVGTFFSKGLPKPLFLRWNGRSWKQVTAPSLDGASADSSLGSVTIVSAGNAWAVGTDHGHLTLAAHWNGSTWTKVPTPDPGSFNQFAAVGASSASNVWAVGTYAAAGPDLTLALHCC